MKSEDNLAIYKQPVVFIFDECHRSQFVEAQKNLKKNLKILSIWIYRYNFLLITHWVRKLQRQFLARSYVLIITDAIRDEKVLKFKVDYNNVRPKFKRSECEKNQEKLTALENEQALLHGTY